MDKTLKRKGKGGKIKWAKDENLSAAVDEEVEEILIGAGLKKRVPLPRKKSMVRESLPGELTATFPWIKDVITPIEDTDDGEDEGEAKAACNGEGVAVDGGEKGTAASAVVQDENKDPATAAAAKGNFANGSVADDPEVAAINATDGKTSPRSPRRSPRAESPYIDIEEVGEYQPSENKAVEEGVEAVLQEITSKAEADEKSSTNNRRSYHMNRRSVRFTGRTDKDIEDLETWVSKVMDKNTPAATPAKAAEPEARELFSDIVSTFHVSLDESPAVLAARSLRLRGLSMSAFNTGVDDDLFASLPDDVCNLFHHGRKRQRTDASSSPAGTPTQTSNGDPNSPPPSPSVEADFLEKLWVKKAGPRPRRQKSTSVKKYARAPVDQRPPRVLHDTQGFESSESSEDEGLQFFSEVVPERGVRLDRFSAVAQPRSHMRKRARTEIQIGDNKNFKLDISTPAVKLRCRHAGGTCQSEPLASHKPFCAEHTCTACGADKASAEDLCWSCSPACRHANCTGTSTVGVHFCEAHMCPSCRGEKSSLAQKCHKCDPRCFHQGGRCTAKPVGSVAFCPAHMCPRCGKDKSSLAQLCHICKPYCHHAGGQCTLAPLSGSYFCGAHSCSSCGGDRPSNSDLCRKCSHQVIEEPQQMKEEESEEELPPERARVYEISDNMVGWQAPFDLTIDRRRVLLCEFPVMKNGKTPRKFHLFSDVLVYTKVIRGQSLEFHGYLMLDKLSILSIGEEPEPLTITVQRHDKDKTDSITFETMAARDTFLLKLMGTPHMRKSPNVRYIMRLIDLHLNTPEALNIVEDAFLTVREAWVAQAVKLGALTRLIEANDLTNDDDDDNLFEDSPKQIRKGKIERCIAIILDTTDHVVGRDLERSLIMTALGAFRAAVDSTAMPGLFERAFYKHGYITTPPPLLVSPSQGRVVWLEGGAGSGTTSLLRYVERTCEVCKWAVVRSNANGIFKKRCYSAWRTVCLQVLSVTMEAKVLAAAKALMPGESEERLQLLDVLLGREHIDLNNDGAELRVNELVDVTYLMLEAFAVKQPVCLLFDSVQWMDYDSVYLLANILERHSRAACKPDMQFFLSTRPMPSMHAAFLRCKAVADYVPVFELKNEDIEAAVARTVKVQMVAPAITEFITAHSGGLPARMTSLLKLLQQEDMVAVKPVDETTTSLDVVKGKPPFDEFFKDRAELFQAIQVYESLSLTQKRLLRVAGVVGRTFSRAIVMEVIAAGVVGSIDKVTISLDLEALVNEKVLQNHDHPRPKDSEPLPETDSGSGLKDGVTVYSFVSACLQEHVVALLDDLEATRIHNGIAEWFERLGDGKFDISVTARHFKKAGVINKAGYYYELMGRRAADELRLEDALDIFDGILTLLETPPKIPMPEDALPDVNMLPRVHISVGTVAYTLGNTAKALQHAQKALSLLGEGAGESTTSVRGFLSQIQFKAPATLPKLLKEMHFPDATTEGKLLVGRGNLLLGALYFNGTRRETSIGIIVKSVSLLERLGPSDDLCICYAQAALAAATVSKAKAALQYIEASTLLLEKYPPHKSFDKQDLEARQAYLFAMVYVTMGQFEQAKPLAVKAKWISTEMGHKWRICGASNLLAQIAFFLGNFSESLLLAREGTQLAISIGDNQNRVDAVRSTVAALTEQGEFTQALNLIKEAQGLVAILDDSCNVSLADLQCLSAQCNARLKKYKEAAVGVDWAMTNLDFKRFKFTTFFSLAALSEAVILVHASLIKEGKTEEAKKYQEYHKQVLSMWDEHGKNSAASKGRSNLYGGWYHLGKDKLGKGKPLLQKALTSGSLFESSLASYLLSSFGATGPKETVKHREAALRGFETLGATYWVNKAKSLD